MTKMGLLIGGLFSGWQYLEAKQTQRVERTFNFAGTLNQGDAAKAREAISAELRGQLPELSRIRAIPMPPEVADEVHAKIARGLMSMSRGGRELGAELDLLLGQFEQIQVCVEKHLCDGDTARAFLGAYAHTLWTNFLPYINDQRQQTIPGYGAGLERFVAGMPVEGEAP
jgi:hypothetical protein